jgi:hypothetical protein
MENLFLNFSPIDPAIDCKILSFNFKLAARQWVILHKRHNRSSHTTLDSANRQAY